MPGFHNGLQADTAVPVSLAPGSTWPAPLSLQWPKISVQTTCDISPTLAEGSAHKLQETSKGRWLEDCTQLGLEGENHAQPSVRIAEVGVDGVVSVPGYSGHLNSRLAAQIAPTWLFLPPPLGPAGVPLQVVRTARLRIFLGHPKETALCL